MPHPNAEKGKRWEQWCAAYLGRKRTNSKGEHDDLGDLDDPAFVCECKDDASRSPMQWWEQAERARIRSGKPWSVVLSKARMPRPGQPRGWAQMSIEQWKEMRAYIALLEAQLERHAGFGYQHGARALRGKYDQSPPGLVNDPLPFPPRPAPECPGKSEA